MGFPLGQPCNRHCFLPGQCSARSGWLHVLCPVRIPLRKGPRCSPISPKRVCKASSPVYQSADPYTVANPRTQGRTPPPGAPEYRIPEQTVYLPRSLLLGKQVICRTNGKSLGYVAELFAEPQTLEVISIGIKDRPYGGVVDAILLSSLRQIGDVVLVHDESVLLGPDIAGEEDGYTRLIGSVVETAAGTKLGKVRNFMFSPDDGCISTLTYDAHGIPSPLENLITSYSVDTYHVQAANQSRIVLQPGAEEEVILENEGALSVAWDKLQGLFKAGYTEGELMSSEYDEAYQRWYAQYGQDWYAYYGQAPKRPAESPSMLALPPPSANRVQELLQQQPRRREPVYAEQLEPAPARMPAYQTTATSTTPQQRFDPRTRMVPPASNVSPSYTERPAPDGASISKGTYDRGEPLSRPVAPQPQFANGRFGPSEESSQYRTMRTDGYRQNGSNGSRGSPGPSQRSQGVPIYDPRPPGPPERRRDADGGLGDAPQPPGRPAQTAAQQRRQQLDFDQWLDADRQQQPGLVRQDVRRAAVSPQKTNVGMPG